MSIRVMILEPVHLIQPTAKEALARLLDGNKRYATIKAEHPNQDLKRRHDIAQGQHPFATILGCSDSRVPPQLIFDQGLGELFVNRIAGNVAADMVISSLAYSTNTLNVPLIMVLGHSDCGAITKALEVVESGLESDDPLIRILTEPVKESLCQSGDRVKVAVYANVNHVVASLKAHQVFRDKVQAGTLAIVGAVYDLYTGLVNLCC